MTNPELDKIVTSVDAAVRRAYALGRKEALDQLVSYAKSDDVVAPPLALAGPDLPPEPIAGANDDAAYDEARMTPVVRNGAGGHHGGIGGLIRDFVFPARAG